MADGIINRKLLSLENAANNGYVFWLNPNSFEIARHRYLVLKITLDDCSDEGNTKVGCVCYYKR